MSLLLERELKTIREMRPYSPELSNRVVELALLALGRWHALATPWQSAYGKAHVKSTLKKHA